MENVFFGLQGNEELTLKLKNSFDGELADFTVRSFPDEETYVEINSDVSGKICYIICSLYHPDKKIIPLYYLSGLCKEFHAAKVVLIAPYLSYMRLDAKFHPGVAVSSEYFGRLLSQWFDELITIDPHLHRKHSLSELYSIPCKVLHAASVITKWIAENIRKPVLIGPDIESEQWVKSVANKLQAPFIILLKTRISDNEVIVTVPDVEKYMDHTPVLLDDIISTAKTMIETVSHIKNAGMKPPVIIGIHGIFAGKAYENLKASGTGEIITCNTIIHHSNKIDISPLFETL